MSGGDSELTDEDRGDHHTDKIVQRYVGNG
jgi:hypothetical protein